MLLPRLTLTHPVLCVSFQQSFFTFCLSSFPHSPPVLSVRHHSQKMLVMSESRLKIQITSGAEIRTNDQDTPFSDWRSFVIMAPTNPVLAPVLRSSSSSSSDFLKDELQQRKELDHFEIQIQLLHMNRNTVRHVFWPGSGFLARCSCGLETWEPRPSRWQEVTSSTPPPTEAKTEGVSGKSPEDTDGRNGGYLSPE